MPSHTKNVAKLAGTGLSGLLVVLALVGTLAVTGKAAPATTWTALASIATIMAAVVAIWTLAALKQDSRDRTRPVLIAELKRSVLTAAVELHVRNVGQSVACNVSVTFDPDLDQLVAADKEGVLMPFLQRRYSRVISTLAPGADLDNVYQYVRNPTRDIPDDFTINLTYTDMHDRPYTDTYHLSVKSVLNQSGLYPQDTDDEGALRKRLANAVEAIARGVGHH